MFYQTSYSHTRGLFWPGLTVSLITLFFCAALGAAGDAGFAEDGAGVGLTPEAVPVQSSTVTEYSNPSVSIYSSKWEILRYSVLSEELVSSARSAISKSLSQKILLSHEPSSQKKRLARTSSVTEIPCLLGRSETVRE